MKTLILFLLLAVISISCSDSKENLVINKAAIEKTNVNSNASYDFTGEYREFGNNRNRFKIYKKENGELVFQAYNFTSKTLQKETFDLTEVSNSDMKNLLGENAIIFSNLWKLNNLYIGIVKKNSIFKHELFGNKEINSDYAVVSSSGEYINYVKE
jgi:hypothetical protein